MENPIKNTLFRFVNLRGPELADEKRKNLRFVFFPQSLQSNSHFYSGVSSSTSKWKTLKDLGKTFENSNKKFTSGQQIKDDFSNIYEFSVWLVRN